MAKNPSPAGAIRTAANRTINRNFGKLRKSLRCKSARAAGAKVKPKKSISAAGTLTPGPIVRRDAFLIIF
jgi:hypothetical protein